MLIDTYKQSIDYTSYSQQSFISEESMSSLVSNDNINITAFLKMIYMGCSASNFIYCSQSIAAKIEATFLFCYTIIRCKIYFKNTKETRDTYRQEFIIILVY